MVRTSTEVQKGRSTSNMMIAPMRGGAEAMYCATGNASNNVIKVTDNEIPNVRARMSR
ncbi:hypothetical protein D3C86_1790140 [compost metagenome]